MKKHLRNQNGQMTIEAVLLLMIMVAGFTLVQKKFKENNYLGNIIEGPWGYVQGMVENGIWGGSAQGKMQHPNSAHRRASPDPV